MVHVAPMGAQGEGSRGPKPCKFQSKSSPDPEVEQSSYQIPPYVKNLSCSWQFPGWPQWARGRGVMGLGRGRGAYVKSNCFMNLILQNACLDFKQT